MTPSTPARGAVRAALERLGGIAYAGGKSISQTEDFKIVAAALSTPQGAGAAKPYCYVIPGDDQARADGSIDARVSQEGEFTKPLYAHPPAAPLVAPTPPQDGITMHGQYFPPYQIIQDGPDGRYLLVRLLKVEDTCPLKPHWATITSYLNKNQAEVVRDELLAALRSGSTATPPHVDDAKVIRAALLNAAGELESIPNPITPIGRFAIAKQCREAILVLDRSGSTAKGEGEAWRIPAKVLTEWIDREGPVASNWKEVTEANEALKIILGGNVHVE